MHPKRPFCEKALEPGNKDEDDIFLNFAQTQKCPMLVGNVRKDFQKISHWHWFLCLQVFDQINEFLPTWQTMTQNYLSLRQRRLQKT